MSKFIPVGDTFEFDRIVFRVVEGEDMTCNGCAFHSNIKACVVHEEFPCCPRGREDDKEVIYVKVVHKGPKDLVTTSDLQALQLTYEQLARIYALSNRCNDYGALSLYKTLQKLLDPDKKVWDEMAFLNRTWDTKYLDFEDHFLSLLFPEDPKITRKKELEEKMRKIQEELDKL